VVLHPEELQFARAYDSGRAFEDLSAEQIHSVMERGRALFKWYKAHPRTHNLISATVLVSILLADGWTLLGLPRLLITNGNNNLGWILFASLIVATVHGWLLYSLGVYSLHEGAAHDAIVSGSGALANAARFFAGNVCRVSQAVPEYYAICHMGHHSKFGTEDDPEFLNFVLPHRLWRSLLPFATIFNFTDFIVHRPPALTRSRVVSGIVTGTYHGVYGLVMFHFFGPIIPVVTFLLMPNIALYFDRFRQFTEHNLMPLDNRIGARNLGVGFWGLLIGGGPWGQPCHLVHHVVASVPWYQQIILHRYMKGLLTPRQKEQFLVTPFVGFPRLFWGIVREANGFARQQVARREV